jgi:hypothetical protein
MAITQTTYGTPFTRQLMVMDNTEGNQGIFIYDVDAAIADHPNFDGESWLAENTDHELPNVQWMLGVEAIITYNSDLKHLAHEY